MIRTIFGKILVIIILVLIISFSLTGLLMNAGLHNLVTEQKEQQLQVTTDKVIAALYSVLESRSNRDPILFTNYIQTLGDNTDSIIWILRKDGAIVFYSSIPNYIKDNLITTNDGLYKLPKEEQYNVPIRKFNSGDFYGLFKDTKKEWVTLTQSFELDISNSYTKAEGLVLIHSPVSSIYKIKKLILVIFLICGVIGAAIALVFVTILAKKTTKPLKQMKLAARKVASGEFTERIQVKGKDEISELTDSFNNMVEALENLEHMRRDFIGNVSHELRTPITTIKGFIEGILDGVIPQERQENYLLIVRDEIRRMQKLVNELLDLAKMQAGEATLKFSDFDINELIRRCVIGLQNLFIEKNLDFKANFEAERMFVNADYDAIQRVIINLLHNSIKFTPKDGEVCVKTYVDKDKTVISVEDTGKGISKEELPYIFERFYKTDKSRSADKTGVGLGLAIVRSIILSHNEIIKVESQEGRGTKFIFTLRSVSKVEPY